MFLNNIVSSLPTTRSTDNLSKQQIICEIESCRNIDATYHMLAIATQAESYGSKSLEILSTQKEQLHKVNNKLYNINSNLNVNNGLLASMLSWFIPSWYKSKLIKLEDEIIKHTDNTTTLHEHVNTNSSDCIIDENITQLNFILCRLKSQALSISQQLDESNLLLGAINPRCDNVAINLGIITNVTSKIHRDQSKAISN